MFYKPFIIVHSSCYTSVIFDYFGQREKEAEEEGIGDDVLGPFDAGVTLEEMVGLSSENDDGGGEYPEEVEDELFFDVGVDESKCE